MAPTVPMWVSGQPIEEISIKASSFAADAFPAYAQPALSFVHEWLTEQDSFTITTSGSTGKPQRIIHRRAQLIASARQTVEFLGLQAGDLSLVCIPTQFIGGRMMLVRGLHYHLPLYLVPPGSQPLAEVPTDLPLRFAAMVPLQMETLLNEAPDRTAQLNQMKAIILGGAPVSDALAERITDLEVPVYSTYGMTETVSHIALRRLNGENPQAYYEVLPGVEVRTQGQSQLSIRGAVTNDEWVETTDVVTLHDDQRFTWLGRADHVINSGGVKVQAEQVEAQLKPHWPGTQAYFVGGIAHPILGQQVTLVVEGEPWPEAQQEEFLTEVEQVLPRFSNPRGIKFVPTFARTSTGKIRRKHIINQLQPT